MKAENNVRAQVAKVLNAVLNEAESLNTALATHCKNLANNDKSLATMICYGVLRNLLFLDGILQKLVTKKWTPKNIVLKYLLLSALYQLHFTRVPDHAALNETVKATVALGFPKTLQGFVNAVLRNYLRQKEELCTDLNRSYLTKYSFPQWLIDRLKASYGSATLPKILEASNAHPPMWLRINPRKCSVANYLELLDRNGISATTNDKVPTAIALKEAVDPTTLPMFNLGAVFVQDAAAQWASLQLPLDNDDIVLDCCSAPGGKTTHLLEICPSIKLVSLDSQADRLVRVKENLARLKQHAEVICYDAAAPLKDWSPYPQYQKILLDAPCSATGVIRRHPDIKWLRTPESITEICALQKKILANIWSALADNGILLYATCSILPEENTLQIKEFLQTHADARLLPLHESDTIEHPGLQILPGEHDMDGFYYARLQKIHTEA